MSLGRVVFISIAAIGGAMASLKPEQRRKLKVAAAKQLRKLANKLVEETNPPMWNEAESGDTDQINSSEEELESEEVASILTEDEVRTINGFKVKK
jgi:coenzyme F420-reducing hydrogenase alpha subunit